MQTVRRTAWLALLATGPGCLLEFDPALVAHERACRSDAVLRCYDFEDPDDLTARLGAPSPLETTCDDGACWAQDLDTFFGGTASLRLDTVSGSGGPPILGLNFTDDLVAIGEGQEVFVQWRQRFAPEMMHRFVGTDGYEFAEGWLQLLLTDPDPPGGGVQDMCGAVQVRVGQDPRWHGPVMSHGCADPTALEENVEDLDVLLQTGPDAVCLYNGGNPMSPPCVSYPAGEWTTYQLHVAIGTYGASDSAIRLWMVSPGRERSMIFDSDDVPLAGPPGGGLGKVWLGPLNYRRDSTEGHAPAQTWYDDLVISREELPDPS